jgi:RNA polymerase sigma-70 factor (ECF subfamily)
MQERKDIKQEFEHLFHEYADVIYRLCLYKTSSEEVAQELTQETFLRLWEKISAGKDIRKPKQYTYQIARNLIVDHYKSDQAVSLDQLQADGYQPEDKESLPDIAADVGIVKEAIQSLDQEFQEVMQMRFVAGMRVKDIAETLDISENLASVRIYRGKEKLEDSLTQ